MIREPLTATERRLVDAIIVESEEHERTTNNAWERQRRKADPTYAERLRQRVKASRERQRTTTTKTGR